jgi:hypothetical protein
MQARMMDAVDIMPAYSPVRHLVTRAAVGVMAAAAVLVAVIFGVGPAIAGSVPGDWLYPAKRAVERGELAFARIAGDESDVLLWQAERRLKEAQALLDDGEYDLDLLADVLNNVERAAAALPDDSGARAQFMVDVGQMMGPLGEAIETSVTRRLGELAAGGQRFVPGPVMTPGPAAPTAQMPVAQPTESPATATPTETASATATATATDTLTATPSATATASATGTSTATPTRTATATVTASPTATVTGTTTATPTEVSAEETDLPKTIVIEGEVEEIDDNVVIIYGIIIRLDPDDPLLSVIQIGDVLRIEGEYDEENDVVVAVIFYFVGIDVVVNDGGGEGGSGSGAGSVEVWRDDGTCSNPPPPWAPAVGWRNRCEDGSDSSGAPGNSGNPPGGPPITPPGGGRP